MATLGDGVSSTLDGVAPPTLCGLGLSTLGGVATISLWRELLHMMAASFLTATMCFYLSTAEVGINLWNTARWSAATVTVFSCLLTAGLVQWDRFKWYVLEILYPLVAET